MDLKTLSIKLFDIGAVKIDFKKGWTLKSGIWSPIYINLRILQSFPQVLNAIAFMLAEKTSKEKIKFNKIASIPLSAVPLGIALSLKTKIPHILPRMDSKKHGLGIKIDGIFGKGEKTLLIDDLITKANSKLEAIDELTQAGLKVKDVLVVLDRDQGGKEELENKGYKLHYLITLEKLLNFLVKENRITEADYQKLSEYLKK